jgi:hypothetical protein
LFCTVAGHNDQQLSLFDRQGLDKFLGRFDKCLFKEGDLIVNVLLETVSEKILSFHSDSLCKALEISGEINDVDNIFDFSDTVSKNLFFPSLEAGSLGELVCGGDRGLWFFSWVDWGDGDGIEFFGGEVVFGKVSDGAAVDTGSALSTDPTEFGQVGGVAMLEFFV